MVRSRPGYKNILSRASHLGFCESDSMNPKYNTLYTTNKLI
jgi:hypothetical protein